MLDLKKQITHLAAEYDKIVPGGSKEITETRLSEKMKVMALKSALTQARNKPEKASTVAAAPPPTIIVNMPTTPPPPAVSTGAAFRLVQSMFGSLTPAPCGDDGADRERLGCFLSKYHLSLEGISQAAPVSESDPNKGLVAGLAQRRQQYIASVLPYLKVGAEVPNELQLDGARLALDVERDPVRARELGRRCRVLRGHDENLFNK